jgi:hypothetical protein
MLDAPEQAGKAAKQTGKKAEITQGSPKATQGSLKAFESKTKSGSFGDICMNAWNGVWKRSHAMISCSHGGLG